MQKFLRLCATIGIVVGSNAVVYACHVKGCPTYTSHATALPQNTAVSIVAPSVPANVSSALTGALNTVSGESGATQNGSGTTFSAPVSDYDASMTSAVNIVFDTTSTTPPSCGGSTSIVGCSSYPPDTSGGSLASTGTITIYLASTTCGGPCFNPSAAGFSNAVQMVIEHELYHGLGIGDTTSDGDLMSRFGNYSGQPNNSAGTQTAPTNCDKKETQRASKARTTGVPCPA